MMWTHGEKNNLVAVEESEDNAVVVVNAKTPHCPFGRVEFFGFKRLMEWIVAEERGAPFCFPLDGDWQLALAFFELISEDEFDHSVRVRSARSDRTFLVLP